MMPKKGKRGTSDQDSGKVDLVSARAASERTFPPEVVTSQFVNEIDRINFRISVNHLYPSLKSSTG